MNADFWQSQLPYLIRSFIISSIIYAITYHDLYKPKRKKRRYGQEVYDLEASLLTRLQGDREVAKRLLGHVRAVYPGRTAKWYLEKVIMDLERDRR